jgi:helix-turn-helix, Psq domain
MLSKPESDCGVTIAVEAKKPKQGRVKSCGGPPQKGAGAAMSTTPPAGIVTPRWIAKRVNEYGWCHHCAVTIPPGAGECSHIALNWLGRKEIRDDIRGTTMSVADAARTYGVNAMTIHRRLRADWCIDCAFTIPRYSGTCQHRKR